MSYDLSVLRAVLRLSRRNRAVTVDELLLRVGGDVADVRAALRALVASDLLQTTPRGPALTLSGLAVAVASLPPKQQPRTAARPKRAPKGGAVALRLGLTQAPRRAA